MNRKLLTFALALLSVALFGCAPVQVTCRMPELPPALAEPPPPPNWFQDQLNSILSPYLTSPAEPTK